MEVINILSLRKCTLSSKAFFFLTYLQDGAQQPQDEIEQLAEYSANLYAKTPEEKAHHLEYYRNFYRSGGDASAAREGLKQQRTAQEEKMKSASSKLPDLGMVTVSGVEHKKYREFNVVHNDFLKLQCDSGFKNSIASNCVFFQ